VSSDEISADGLSRVEEFAYGLRLRRRNKMTRKLKHIYNESSTYNLEDRGKNKTTIWCDTLTSTPRSFLTKSFQQVFDVIHNLTHPEIKLTVKLVALNLTIDEY